MTTTRILTILLLFCCIVLSAQARDYIALSTSAANVQAAVSACANGDRAIVPSGSAIWSTTVSITNGITLIGGGGTNGVTAIAQGGGDMTEILDVSGTTGFSTVINGFQWTETYPNSATACFIELHGANNTFIRFCSNQVLNCTSGIKIDNTGEGTQLVDNNYWTLDFNDCWEVYGNNDGAAIYGNSGGVSSQVGNWGHGTTYGGTNYCFIEHNGTYSTYTGLSPTDGPLEAYGGAMFVLRYNFMTNGVGGWHGQDSGGYTSTHSYEIYKNYCYFEYLNGNVHSDAFNSRGGTGLIWSNTFAGITVPKYDFLMQNYRGEGESFTPWGTMTGSNPYDGNTDGTGYPGLGQQGETGPIGGYVLTGSGGSSTQHLSPTYIWGNAWDFYQQAIGDDSNVNLNRDYYTNNPTYSNGTFTNFAGSPGMSYTPLAYPYPLAPSGLPAPTGLSILPNTVIYGTTLRGSQ